MSIFEKAVRNKLRFESSKGWLTVEDLWDLSLNSLDTVAKKVNKQLRDSHEESFLTAAKPSSNKTLELQLEILKHVIQVKEEEDKKRKTRAEKQAQLTQLRELAALKAGEALAAQSLEDLQKMIASLEAEDAV